MTYSRSPSQCMARSEVKMQLCLITCCFPLSTGLCSINICCTSHIKLLGMLSRKRYTVISWSRELINPVILNVFSIEQQSLKKCWELCYNKRARTHYRLLVILITSCMLCMGKTWNWWVFLYGEGELEVLLVLFSVCWEHSSLLKQLL